MLDNDIRNALMSSDSAEEFIRQVAHKVHALPLETFDSAPESC